MPTSLIRLPLTRGFLSLYSFFFIFHLIIKNKVPANSPSVSDLESIGLVPPPLRYLVVLCCSLFIFFHYVSSNRFSVTSSKLRPALAFYDVAQLTESSIVSPAKDFDDKEFRVLRVEDRVLFPDHVLLLVSSTSPLMGEVECVYHQRPLLNSTVWTLVNDDFKVVTRPVVSTDEYDEFRSIVRCPLPPLNYSAAVELRSKEMVAVEEGRGDGYNLSAHSWDMVAYEAMLDGETAVVFVKGLNLRPGRASDPTQFSCHFGLGKLDRNETFVLTTKAISAAQEAVRCALPHSIRNNPVKAQGLRVAVGVDQIYHGRVVKHTVLPSVAMISRAGLGLRLRKLDFRIVPLERKMNATGLGSLMLMSSFTSQFRPIKEEI